MTAGGPSASTPPAPVNDSMRRLQIGIAGLLTVLLLVGMAGLIGDRARQNAAQEAPATTQMAPLDAAKAGSAPLEELGVQPVSKDQNEVGGVKAPQPAPAVPDLEPDPALARARQSKQ
ncbi:MAG TPA: hypothetical protein VHO04_08895 [Sphingopyxis sp.]|jgi:hypothetical protein|uniref:hypothetical protein n=1 Tax=Sphingopyxis sp. TaxID=1908224 RepID=UPI002E31C666|nr:hypothetical protein [Sphingopyxis sp.]HEX2812784.1 hypothetical protein [Sphingopyxis sp.]